MKKVRTTVVMLVLLVFAGLGARVFADQARGRPADREATVLVAAPPLEIDQIEPTDFFRYRHRAVLRIWQDYFLRANDEVGGIVVIFGAATIEGRVDGDVVVVLGQVRLASTAVVGGSVVAVAGDATVTDGASIRGDLVVVGGGVSAPANFSPGGEHIIVGTPWLGDQIRAIAPWFTRGLLWGRLIVPNIGWVWSVVFVVLLISLLINQLVHGPVGVCADTLAKKPFSTFLVGLLVLLLAGPLSLLLAATVVGLVVVPFLWTALFVSWTIGKVGVLRWIGRAVTGQGADESKLDGLRSFLIGFVVVFLLYMVPVLGLMTWAIVGVFGLGAATQAFLAAIRRERPAPPAERTPAPPPAPVAPPPAPHGPPPIEDAPAAAFVAVDPLAGAGPASRASPAGIELGATPAVATAVGELALMPRATFLDRLAALVLDVLLVLMVRSLLVFREDEVFFVLLFAYYVGFWAWKGTTIGGIVCNLRVVRTDGQSLRFVDALVRALSGIFSFVAFGLGFLWILKDPEKQAWHDRIAGTYVVRVPRTWPLP
jgi:uncharacterized RDD family membrane protein YckC